MKSPDFQMEAENHNAVCHSYRVRNACSHQTLGEARSRVSPRASGRRTAQLTPWFGSAETDFRNLASRSLREYISVIFSHEVCENLPQLQLCVCQFASNIAQNSFLWMGQVRVLQSKWFEIWRWNWSWITPWRSSLVRSWDTCRGAGRLSCDPSAILYQHLGADSGPGWPPSASRPTLHGNSQNQEPWGVRNLP